MDCLHWHVARQCLPLERLIYISAAWTKLESEEMNKKQHQGPRNVNMDRPNHYSFDCLKQRDHITNEEVKARIGNAIGPYEDLLTSVKKHNLKGYGHITQSSGLAKTILQVTVQGGR